MLLCVILVWPTKFENSLYSMQNVLEAWEFKEDCLNILILGNLGSKHVFLKSISSHTHAFCSQNSMLWGVSAIFYFDFKNIFPEIFWLGSVHFNRSKLFFDQLKLHLKFLGWFCVFRSIEINFQSIENRIESFLKHLILTCSNTFSKSFQTLSLFIRSVKAPIKIFCRFPLFFLQGFSPLRPVRPFYPFFCIHFHVSCIKSCIYGEISNL